MQRQRETIIQNVHCFINIIEREREREKREKREKKEFYIKRKFLKIEKKKKTKKIVPKKIRASKTLKPQTLMDGSKALPKHRRRLTLRNLLHLHTSKTQKKTWLLNQLKCASSKRPAPANTRYAFIHRLLSFLFVFLSLEKENASADEIG